jgi:TetR/AcrR family transcriptional repressor of nem operon
MPGWISETGHVEPSLQPTLPRRRKPGSDEVPGVGRISNREKLIRAGVRAIREHGYANVGVREITATAEVSHGSFTNHFRTKEAFGVVILDREYERIEQIVDRTLRNAKRSPVEKLWDYFETITSTLEASNWRYGSIIGNLSAEVPEHCELLRAHLVKIWRMQTNSLTDVISMGQASGDIRGDLDAHGVATTLLSSWEGAVMRMKVERSPEPLECLKCIIFSALLPRPVHQTGSSSVVP